MDSDSSSASSSPQSAMEELTMDRSRRITPGSILIVRSSSGNLRTITVGREIYNPMDPRIVAVTFYGPDLPAATGDEVNRGDAGDLDDLHSDHEEDEYDDIEGFQQPAPSAAPTTPARPTWAAAAAFAAAQPSAPTPGPAPRPRGKALPPSQGGAPLQGPCTRCRKMKKRCDWSEGRPCLRCRAARLSADECIEAGPVTPIKPKTPNNKRGGGGGGSGPASEKKRGPGRPPSRVVMAM